MNRRRLTTEESGYTLMEVMVSIIILAIAIIPMVGMFDMALTSTTSARNLDQARALANEQIERVEGLTYSQAIASYAPPTPACTVTIPSYLQQQPRAFSCQINTYYVNENNLERPAAPLLSGNTMEVVVRISWGPSTNRRDYTTTSLVSKGGT